MNKIARLKISGRTMSDKRLKFKELAKSRVNRATAMIRLIGNLGNKSLYDYDASDVKKITEHLRKQVKLVEDRFNSKKRSTEEFEI
tara:strand:+ start:532 stop:789 length:258 start_codon:yes stop_codon:yes gene_type:complete